MTRIKICGITNFDDARSAISLGADAIGFVFADSPRQISPGIAGNIIDRLPPMISRVGVFVDETVETVMKVAAKCHLTYVQLHGQESIEYMNQLIYPTVKSFRIKEEADLETVIKYQQKYVLLDSYVENQPGGTGQTFDWELARRAKAFSHIILSGGLDCENVTEALDEVQPYGVDVSSGVESSPGKKDNDLMRKFIEEVHLWDSRQN